MTNLTTGILDVSHDDTPRGSMHDALTAAIADGLVLLIAKATEGGLRIPPPYVDPSFHAWSDGAGTLDLQFGAYHFMRNTDTGAAQAEFFYDSIVNTGRDPSQMALAALDFEPHRDSAKKTTNPDPAIANAFVERWFALTGRYPWIYCDQSRAAVLHAWNTAHNGSLHLCPLWLAGYGIPPWPDSKLGPAIIWQYTGAQASGGELPHDQHAYPVSIAGLGKTDRSAFRGTREELLALLASAGLPVSA